MSLILTLDENTGLFCLQHDRELELVYIDDEGEIETELADKFLFPNGLACPMDDCTVVIYEGDKDV